jgi:aspartate-semialdehyde dehydrogenase
MKNIVIVGATGAVGKEMLAVLHQRDFPIENLHLTASSRSVGKEIETPFGNKTIEALTPELLEQCDIALFSAGSDISKQWLQACKDANCLMIDNSSAFRYEEDVPLVIPEINPEAAQNHNGVIANPNCTTAIAAVALYPLHKAFKLKKVIISTYQATSGAGAAGMQELLDQTAVALENAKTDSHDELEAKAFAHPIAFNLIPHIDSFQKNAYTKEEMKVTWETRKIFNEPELLLSCTAVRIPTLRAHSESIVIETEEEISPVAARKILAQAPGVDLVDNPKENTYPMPLNASGKFNVEVGRIRQNIVFGEHGLEFFVCGDQLLKGAALNAVQIAELFI